MSNIQRKATLRTDQGVTAPAAIMKRLSMPVYTPEQLELLKQQHQAPVNYQNVESKLNIKGFSNTGGALSSVDSQDKKNMDKQAKLLANLEQLGQASANLSEGLKKQQEENEQKLRQSEIKQQDVSRQIEGKLLKTINIKDNVRQDLEEKKVKLREVEEVSIKIKQEIMSVKQFQDKIIKDMAGEADEQLQSINQRCKDLTEEVEDIKGKIRDERKRRKDLEAKIEQQEDTRMLYANKLNDLGKDIQNNKDLSHTTADFDNEKQQHERLTEKLKQLKEMKSNLQNQNKEITSQAKELSSKVQELKIIANSQQDTTSKRKAIMKRRDELKQENKVLFDLNLKLFNALQQFQGEAQMAESKRLELVEVANLLKDQNKFEKQSRTLQTRIEDIEDQQRLQENTYKEVQINLKTIQTETEQESAFMQQMIKDFQIELEKSVEDKQTVEDNMKQLMSKVCNKAPNELKVDQIDEYFEQLEDFETQLDDAEDTQWELDKKQQDLRKAFFNFEKKLKHQYYDQNEDMMIANDKTIVKLLDENKQMNDRLARLDQSILEKVSTTVGQMQAIDLVRAQVAKAKGMNKKIRQEVDQEKVQLKDIRDNQDHNKTKLNDFFNEKVSLNSEPTNIQDFTSAFRDSEDQKKRLEEIKETSLRNLEEELHKIATEVNKLEEGLQGDKVESCLKEIDKGKKKVEDFEGEIQKQEEKLRVLKTNASKANPDEEKEINDEIAAAQRNLDRLRAAKDEILKELDALSKSNPEDLVENLKNMNDLMAQLENLQTKDIKEREKEIEGIEAKLRQAIRDKRIEQRKECLEAMEKCKTDTSDLAKIIDKIRYKIEGVTRDAQQLDKSFSYKDQERDKQTQDQLNEPLEEKRKILQKLQIEKDSLTEISNKLNQDFDQLTSKLVAIPTITSQSTDLKEGDDSQIDEAVYQWKLSTQKAKENNINLQRALDKANQQLDHCETLGHIFNEMMEKYKQKSQLYKDCQNKQKSKQEIVNKQKENFNTVQKKLQNIDDTLKKVILPENNDQNNQFVKDFYEAQNDLIKAQENLEKQLIKREQLQGELNSICVNLPLIGDRVITTKELQNIKDDLDKLDLEANYLNDEIKSLDFDIETLNNAVGLIVAQDKKILADLDDIALNALENDFTKLDKVHQETAEKMKEYASKIKDGLWTEDQELRKQLKQLQDEAEALERDLKAKERLKNSLKQQDKQNRDLFASLKLNPKKSPIEDFQTVGQNFQNIDEQAKQLADDLENIKVELDKKIKDLGDYMSKYNDLLGLYSEFDGMTGDIKNNFKNFQQKILDSKDMISSIESVLKEMQLGVNRDYELKENFISQEQEELEDVRNTLKRLEEMILTSFKPKIKDIQTKGNQQLDTDELQTVMTQAQEILEELESAETMATSCFQRLKQIKVDIGDADVPELTKLREREIVEFSGKLRTAEQEVYDIRKTLQTSKGVENFKEVEQQLKDIEVKIQIFKQDRQNYKRILAQELIIYLSQPRALEDYSTLKLVITKLRNLGNQLNNSLQQMIEIEVTLVRMKRDIGGMDLMKRYEQQKKTEDEQRQRLQTIKNRLERIEKGAQDCDGFTSNTEEATFIETLLSELPEMKQKQYEATDECDVIIEQLDVVKRDIDKAQNPDGSSVDEQAGIIAASKLDDIEEQTGTNEKTIVFLEKLLDKLEDHFMNMEVKKKLDKRQMELNELANICTDFEEQLTDMQEHILKDIEKIDEKKKGGPQALQEMMVDEAGHPVNLLEEVNAVQNELKEILVGVTDLQDRNKEIQVKREEAQNDFNDQILKKSPYKTQTKITNKHDVFSLIRANGWIKKRIVEMIKNLKDVSKKMKDYKSKYSVVRTKIEKSNKPKRMYKAVKGDLVDEMFADYINKLNCPVPIKRMGNNQYTFGTKKIFAKIINGKLVIRVGGGYMGIEEFMMYYGQQELTRLQKQEMLKNDNNESEIFAGIDIVSDTGDDQDGEPKNMDHVDIDTLKKKISEQSAKKRANKSLLGDDKEEQKDDKALIVGIGDVRKALKKNLVEIKVYDEHSSVGAYKGSTKGQKKVNAESNLVEKHLKQMERNIETKLNKQSKKEQEEATVASARKLTTASKKKSTMTTTSNSFRQQKVMDQSQEQSVEEASNQSETTPMPRKSFGSSRIPPMKKSTMTPLAKVKEEKQ